MGRIILPDKEENKRTKEEFKADFHSAIRDKKRWLTCLIEIGIAGVLLAIDLLLKEFLYKKCLNEGRIAVWDGVFSFTAVQNTGASFGIFGNSTAALTVVSLVCSAFLFFFIFYSYPRRNLWLRASLIMILGGAVGNVVDRIALGYVRDYVYFELINFPVWNFADTCLTVGTVLLIIYIIFMYSKEEAELQKVRAERLRERRSEQKDVEETTKEEVPEPEKAEAESENTAPEEKSEE